jgi:hypothetical protein
MDRRAPIPNPNGSVVYQRSAGANRDTTPPPDVFGDIVIGLSMPSFRRYPHRSINVYGSITQAATADFPGCATPAASSTTTSSS